MKFVFMVALVALSACWCKKPATTDSSAPVDPPPVSLAPKTSFDTLEEQTAWINEVAETIDKGGSTEQIIYVFCRPFRASWYNEFVASNGGKDHFPSCSDDVSGFSYPAWEKLEEAGIDTRVIIERCGTDR